MVDDIAFKQIILQDLIRPLAEFNTSFGINSKANGDDRIKIIKFDFSFDSPFSFLSN